MKKIGILLAFAPEQPIKNHGIGRLTAFIISAILKTDDVKVVIAIPAWYKKIILEFFDDHQIDPGRIELLTTNGIPYLLRIHTLLKKIFRHFKRVKYQQLRFNFRNMELSRFSLVIKGLATSSILYFVLTNVLLFLFLVPLAVMGLFVTLIVICLKYISSNSGDSMKMRIKSYTSLLMAPLSTFRRNKFISQLYHEIRKVEVSKLIKKINRDSSVDAWFIPTLFWPEVANIKAKKIVAAPDIVFLDFPLLFSSQFFGMVYNQIAQTIRVADHFICYSEHVKQKHLVNGFLVPSSRVSVIKHGAIDLRPFISKVDMSRAKYMANQILRTYQWLSLGSHPYLKDFNFINAGYIFYSSQIRPHKNFMSLIKAYEILLRKRFINVKLITTADLTQEKEVWNYIIRRNLQHDILCLTEVSSEVLAALNHLAICAVNPTLFEGGFPFTFTEAYSVGTPSVMSSISMILDEVDDPALREKMLFDPYSVDDMVNKIEWSINNRDKLFALEAPLYQKMEARSWEMVASDYIDVFKSVSIDEKVDEIFV